MSAPEYPNRCLRCNAAPQQRCRTQAGRVTDTHKVRVQSQFDRGLYR